MNSDLKNTTPKNQNDFLEEFAQTQQAEQEQKDFERLFDANDVIIADHVTANDILNCRLLYDYAQIFADDTDRVKRHFATLKKVAEKFKLTSEFYKNIKAHTPQIETSDKKSTPQREADNFPSWWNGRTIDEDCFCDDFLKHKELRCINSKLYDFDGLIDDGRVENLVYEKIKGFWKNKTADKVRSIVKALKIKCFTEMPPADINTIHLKNGTLKTDGTFTPKKEFTMFRLNVAMPQKKTTPKKWLEFLNELLEPEDIPTLQGFLGYCFIPCTKAQKMLFIVGGGSNGKSRIGIVMEGLLGKNLYTGTPLKKILTEQHASAFLDGRLLSCSDDLSTEKLSDTSLFKEIVTAEGSFHINVKYGREYDTQIYARLMAFSNGILSALYDNSDGFYRRQIILTAKPKPADRENDSFLTEKLLSEKEQIFLWAFDGLKRLIANGFKLTVSDAAKKTLDDNRRNDNNIIPFMESKHDFCFCGDEECHSKELYWAYADWCDLNDLEPLKKRTFVSYLKSNANKYHIEYSENATNQHGSRARGFRGIKYTKIYNTVKDI